MAFLGENDLKKIEIDLKDKIELKLLDGFKTKKTRLVIKVDFVMVEFKIDEDRSDRDNIIIGPVKAAAKVWVDNNDNNSQGNDYVDLRINSVKFSYNSNSKSYEIAEDEQLDLIDMS